jgi:hypothetical protein
MTNTISAAANPALANDLIKKVVAEKPQQKEVEVTPPSDTLVTLPGGYLDSETGEVITEAEVRELNGKDEEAIARASTTSKALLTILQRGSVRVGNQKITEDVLDKMLSGDRDMLLLSILKVTFGANPPVGAYCGKCQDVKTVEVDIDTDIKVQKLADPINDRVFTVQGKNVEFTVQLPTGITQKELILNADKTAAELNTILLENTVMKIGNSPVIGKAQVQNLSLTDRRKIVDAINERIPGPKFDSLTVTCPDCESEVSVPISLGALFRI